MRFSEVSLHRHISAGVKYQVRYCLRRKKREKVNFWVFSVDGTPLRKKIWQRGILLCRLSQFLQAFRSATLLKRDSNTGVFLRILRIFLRTPILKNSCFWILKVFLLISVNKSSTCSWTLQLSVWWVLGGKKCSFFEKLGVLCFLDTSVLRFDVLLYYWQIIRLCCVMSFSLIWFSFKGISEMRTPIQYCLNFRRFTGLDNWAGENQVHKDSFKVKNIYKTNYFLLNFQYKFL